MPSQSTAPPFPIDRYLNVRSASGPSFSPDGRFVSFLTNVTGVAQLWRVPVQGGWPVQLTFGSDSVRGGWYNPRRHELIFAMDKGGNERTGLYRLHGVGQGTDHDLGEGWLIDDLTRHPEAVHLFGGWSHDGDRFAFSANREDPSRFDVYVQKLGDREAHLLHKGPGGYYLAAGWSPDDRSLLVSRQESNRNQDLFVLDVATGMSRHLTPHRGEAQYLSPCWSGDGKWVFCITASNDQDRTMAARIELARGRLQLIFKREGCELEGMCSSPGGRWLAWLVNVGGKSELYRQGQAGPPFPKPPELPLGVASQLEFSRDDGRLAFVFNGPRYNPDVWVWDLHANRLRQLTHSSRAGLPLSQFVEPELIHYPTFDGREIPAWFYRPASPPSGGRLPQVIVYVHGGPESQERPNFTALFQYFLQRGYAVLAPNVRGSRGYGTAYMNLDNTVRRMDSVADVAHAVYWLRDHKQADPKRVAIYGGSYGGFMVLASVTTYPDLWAAGIDVVGIANWVTFLENTGPYRRANREAEYGNLREHRAFLEKISPIHHVDRIKCPMMVIHGSNDPRVPVGEAEQIVAALRRRHIPVEYLRYPDEGHGLVKLKNRLDAYPKMAAFLDRYLK